MSATQQTWAQLTELAVVTGRITEGMALAADQIWQRFTSDEQRDTLAIFTRQNWGEASKGSALTHYVLGCADLMADRA